MRPFGETTIGFDFANIYRPVVKETDVSCGLCVEVFPHPSLPIKIVSRIIATVTRRNI
jgi:ferredoxin-type protein NapG